MTIDTKTLSDLLDDVKVLINTLTTIVDMCNINPGESLEIAKFKREVLTFVINVLQDIKSRP